MRRRSRRSLHDALFELPWWINAAAAVFVYVCVGIGGPLLLSASPATAELAATARACGWVLAIVVLIPAPFSVYRRYRRGKLLEAHTDLAAISSLHWQEFEKLVAEAFNRIGYVVSEAGGAAAEAGIDLIATAPGERILVQCKHWRAAMVGVSTVGELFELMMAEKATGGAVVTSGTFSEDALAFTTGKPIELIDGAQLEKLVLSVRKPEGARVRVP